ncbi:MAG: hypothetical protein LBL66_09060 [Clostridiales bacterium]|jgi:hypothetical protein|nr:hypothetical protein [Clostridiales bacterium]
MAMHDGINAWYIYRTGKKAVILRREGYPSPSGGAYLTVRIPWNVVPPKDLCLARMDNL